MREVGERLLHLLKPVNAFLGLPRPQQRERVVDLLALGAWSQVQGLLELVHGLRLGGWVLVESFAQIAEAPQAFVGGVGGGGEQEDETGGGEDTCAHRYQCTMLVRVMGGLA